mgnify:CR=1 FL=1|jgi:Trypsin-like peptidase domain
MDSDLFRDIYEKYAAAVAYISVESVDGTQSIGTAFHVGDGIYVTAKHVVENKNIIEVATTERSIKDAEDASEEDHARKIEFTHWPGKGKVIGGPYLHPDKDIDVAALKVEGIKAPVIPLGDHLDDWLGTELVLMEAVVLGYPPIPFSREPTLVATKAEVNAIIDKYTGGHPHFILSPIARGGFSGGPAITRYGCTLGLVTESLTSNGNAPELGYLAVLSVEPIYNLLSHHSIVPDHVDRLWDGFWNTNSINLYDPSAPIGFQHAIIDYYTGVMGKYLKIFSANENALKSALEIVSSEIKSDSYEIEVIHEKMKKIVFDDSSINNKCVIEIRDKIVERFLGFEMVLGFGS